MSSSSPPSPPGLPLVGHALAFRRDPLALLASAAELGPIVELRLASHRLWLLTRAELVDEVLVAGAGRFVKSRLLRQLGRLVLGDALDTLDGESWLARVKQVAPAFKKPHVDRLLPVIARLAETFAEQGQLDETTLLELSLRVQLRLFLGLEREDVAPLARAIRRALRAWNARLRFGLPTPDWLPAPHNLAMRRAMRPLRALVAATIAERRRASRTGDDLLAPLLDTGLDDAALTDELTTMTFLGAHQVALALGWTLQSLAEHPLIQERAAAEAMGEADPAPLSFIAMTLEESLRLHPPFHLLVRDTVEDGELGGFRLPRGTTLACSPWVLGRSARYFDAPDQFRPERWLGARPPRGAHIPFGAGPRICIANGLVRRQLTLVLAAVLRRLRVALIAPPRPPRPDVTLAFDPPLRLAATMRDRVAVVEAAS